MTVKGIELLTDKQIYDRVILDLVPSAKTFLWLATSDLKDLHVHKGKRMVPFLAKLSELIDNGVEIRLLHASEPGPAFRRDFDKYPNLIDGMERLMCPRVHFKTTVIDGRVAYSGSANLTGAGMGAKSSRNRNFETGFVTEDQALIDTLMAQFDKIWIGNECETCGRKKYCTDPL
jgi:phosphatidylserine/phosphatidylglycerophosphate/cardiolipin synthase-like enzyme